MTIHNFPGRGTIAPPPGGGDNGEMDARVSKLEAILPYLATKADVESVKGTIAESKVDLLKVLIPTILSLGAIGVAVLLFAINRISTPQAPTAAPAPIVIYSQPQAPPAPAKPAKP